MKICGIYKITSPSGKIYIGQSIDCKRRERAYKYISCKTQILLYRSIKKYGWDAHKFEIIHQCTREELNDLEVHYVNLHQSYSTEHGLNLKPGGGNRVKLSEQTKQKIREGNKGKIVSEETRKKMSISMTGKKHGAHTEDWKHKNSLIKKGKPLSEKNKKNISLANKGRKFTSEHIEKLRQAKLKYPVRYWLGKKRTNLKLKIK